MKGSDESLKGCFALFFLGGGGFLTEVKLSGCLVAAHGKRIPNGITSDECVGIPVVSPWGN